MYLGKFQEYRDECRYINVCVLFIYTPIIPARKKKLDGTTNIRVNFYVKIVGREYMVLFRIFTDYYFQQLIVTYCMNAYMN